MKTINLFFLTLAAITAGSLNLNAIEKTLIDQEFCDQMERLDFDAAHAKISRWKEANPTLAFIPDVASAYLLVSEGEFDEAEKTFEIAVTEMRTYGMPEDFIVESSENFFRTRDEIREDYIEGCQILMGKKRGLFGRIVHGTAKAVRETVKFAASVIKKAGEMGRDIKDAKEGYDIIT